MERSIEDSSQNQYEKVALDGVLKGNQSADDEFIKYVWNKKTKRLEKKDMRDAANLGKIDAKKFQNFSKVNQKSKILCMQL